MKYDLTRRFGFLVSDVAKVYGDQFDALARERIGLSRAQVKLLSVLAMNEGGHAVYKLSPEELAKYHKHFVVDYGVRIVGGCCGTGPEHLKAVVEAVAGVEPAKREVKPTAAASSSIR